MQGTQVWSPVQEDSTCNGATKPVHHNYWAFTLEPTSHNHWARMLQLPKLMHLKPVILYERSHCNEKSMCRDKEQPRSLQPEEDHVQQQRPSTARINPFLKTRKLYGV